MSTRRKFVKKLATGLASTILPMEAFSQTASTSLASGKDDPEFWQQVRASFPLTKDRTYFNNGTSGPSPNQVLDVIRAKMDEFSKSGEYGSIEKARERIAQFVKVKTEEISLTHNTTEGVNILVWGLPLKKGDEVIISLHEHVGNALPWINRAKLHGIKLKTFQPVATASGNLDLIRNLITSRTRVIAVPHITCTTGLVFPIEEISALAKSKGIFTAIDGAHGPGMLNIDLKKMGCDFYATSCHKWMLGPGGTGFLYVRQELLDILQVYQVGAYSDAGWDLTTTPMMKGYNPTAHRYDYGSQSASLFAGAEASVNFMEEIGMEKVEKRVKELATRLQGGLLQLGDKVEMLTPVEERSRAGMVSFKLQSKTNTEFNTIAGHNKFRIRIVPESGLNAIRISTHIYNNEAEIDRFVNLVKENT
jgi:cysteine desulfurase/selenocysteine lyase